MKKSITVNASCEAVWKAILSYRTSEPSKRKVTSSSEGNAVIEEKFGAVPVVGASRVVYKETEKPYKRIDYVLVESDKLNKFHGSWILAEKEGGKGMVVELTTELDSALPIPFKEHILNSQALADIEKRLHYVKRQAEKGG